MTVHQTVEAMELGFAVDTGLSGAAVFVQGLLSFFSPCVLPLLPLYLGYLSGGVSAEGDSAAKRRGRTFLNTLFFVIGISFAIFLLGLGMSLIGSFFGGNRLLFARIGGVLVILFGLYQLGVFGGSSLLSGEKRLPLRLDKMAMSPWTALLMGFVFSFAWTPCVGPALSGVLLLAASASSRAVGYSLLGLYTLGFCIPFLALGLFTTSLLDVLRRHRGIARYSAKIGGALLLLMGVLMLTGYMNNVTGYLSRLSTPSTVTEEVQTEETAAPEAEEGEEAAGADGSDDSDERPVIPALDFELTDQYGMTHTLEQYRGKVVFLNFWATWCPPCRAEMPDIQSLYEKYGPEHDEVAILAVATPGYNGEGSEAEVKAFLEENGYTYPVLMDGTGELMRYYGISAIPTTFMIDTEGNIYGYVPGAMSAEIMQSIIDQTLQGGVR